MTKVISTKSISFPKLGWGITAGVETELPEDEAAQERILQEADITIVAEALNKKVESEIKNNN